MNSRDELIEQAYTAILHHGLQAIQECLSLGNAERMKIEVEHLHNLPSLIFEKNIERHRYYWEVERDKYLTDLSTLCDERATRTARLFYKDHWETIRKLIFDSPSKNGSLGSAPTP